MKFRGYIIKRKLENILMFPFILLGKLLALIDPLPAEYRIFYFFPFYHTGGAEKVHEMIAKATGGRDCIIFFTRRSVDDTFLQAFKEAGCETRDISRYVDVQWLYFLKFIWRGKVAGYINRQSLRPVILNGQSNFGYKISPWINKEIKQVELIHSFNSFSWIRIPFLPFIAQTIMISKRRIAEHIAQYKTLAIPDEYVQRIHFIQNAIELPEEPCDKNFDGTLKALFVGRGTPEKRPELFVAIAGQCRQVQFTLVGEMPGELRSNLPANVSATGNINNKQLLQQLYCEHHVLIIPSSTEGFPIVLMEAMANGCAVMASPVGDIPYHINDQNGWLFSSTDAPVILREAATWLEGINMHQLRSLSMTARDYAFKNFDAEVFNQQYKAILQP